MYELLTTFGPLVLFMLTPLFIPIFAVTFGALFDRLNPQAKPVPVRVSQRDERSR